MINGWLRILMEKKRQNYVFERIEQNESKSGRFLIFQSPTSKKSGFSLQMMLESKKYYPDLARTIYLRGYRYNLHLRPKTLLVECGAQTNTVQEEMNAMEPLADILNKVLTGS